MYGPRQAADSIQRLTEGLAVRDEAVAAQDAFEEVGALRNALRTAASRMEHVKRLAEGLSIECRAAAGLAA